MEKVIWDITSVNLFDVCSKVLEYNVPYGKKNRGLAVVDSYKLLAHNDITAENLKVARIVGWCIEMVSALSFNSKTLEIH